VSALGNTVLEAASLQTREVGGLAFPLSRSLRAECWFPLQNRSFSRAYPDCSLGSFVEGSIAFDARSGTRHHLGGAAAFDENTELSRQLTEAVNRLVVRSGTYQCQPEALSAQQFTGV
jgi:hypothetical protein